MPFLQRRILNRLVDYFVCDSVHPGAVRVHSNSYRTEEARKGCKTTSIEESTGGSKVRVISHQACLGSVSRINPQWFMNLLKREGLHSTGPGKQSEFTQISLETSKVIRSLPTNQTCFTGCFKNVMNRID